MWLEGGSLKARDLRGPDETVLAVRGVTAFDIVGQSAAWVLNDPPSAQGHSSVVLRDLASATQVVLDSGVYSRGVAMTERWVAWSLDRAGRKQDLKVMDRRDGSVREIANGGNGDIESLAVSGDLMVWSQRVASPDHQGSYDLFGYDLAARQAFIVNRSIGSQLRVQLSGRRVVWEDTRHSGNGKYEFSTSIYTGLILDGPAAPPVAHGSPDAVDARIEIVTGFGDPATGQAATSVRLGARLFKPGSVTQMPACTWRAMAGLWVAVNGESARSLGTLSQDDQWDRGALWLAETDATPAQDPNNRMYFFVRVPGVPTQSNVWSHGQSPTTVYPASDVPTGVGLLAGSVDAKIEQVWPHDDAPVAEAGLVNITAMLFVPDTRVSAPPDAELEVNLLAAVNQDVLKPIAKGVKRLVAGDGYDYSVWDFNDVDVSAVPRDPDNNKYFFMLDVAGLQTQPNVWVHGVNGLTIFPLQDKPVACDRLLPATAP